MTATILRPQFRQAPVRCIDAEPHPVRAHAEALMRALVKDPRNDRAELALVADLLDPMIARAEHDV